jgi:hypothetical protein
MPKSGAPTVILVLTEVYNSVICEIYLVTSLDNQLSREYDGLNSRTITRENRNDSKVAAKSTCKA